MVANHRMVIAINEAALSDHEKEVLLDHVKGKCANHNLACMSSASYANEERVLQKLISEDSAYDTDFDTTLATELCTGMNKQYDAQEESDRPAVTQLLRACVFLFEQHGKNSEYYLNESDQIREWLKTASAVAVAKAMHEAGLQDTPKPKLQKLPPMKGSRQHVWLELAFWVLRNYRYYYAYLEQLRIRANANKLVKSVHRGLKDKYILAALAARGLTWMHEIWPARFLINDLADRPSLHSIFSSLSVCIQSGVDNETNMLLVDMAEKYPGWKKEIDSFIRNAEKDNSVIAKCATSEVDPIHVAKFRAARVAPMIASAERNVDGEETSAKAKHAPTTTDSVESGFGTVDQGLHKTSASLHAVFGITMMRRTHMLQSREEIKEKTRTAQKRKFRHRGIKVDYGGDIDDDSDKWDLCSLMTWPKEERFRLYRSVLAAYDEECVKKPKQQTLEHDNEAYQRKLKASESAAVALFKLAVKQAVWFKLKRAISKTELNKMLKDKKKVAVVAILREQVNIRRYVDSIKQPIPKRTGGGGWLSGTLTEGEVAKFRGHVEAMVKNEKYAKPPVIVPALQFEGSPSYAGKFAKQLEEARKADLQKIRGRLAQCMVDGSFKAVLGSTKRPKKLKAIKRSQARKAPTSEEREVLQDYVFEDEGTTWKVLKVQ